ncbi:MAG: hypothetical protein EOP21_08555, partial [Hyphomicrobiales bacterium]
MRKYFLAAAATIALQVKPDSTDALQNLSIAQWASGFVTEGIESIRRATEIDSSNIPAWSNLLMYLQYSADHSEGELLAAAKAWGRTMHRRCLGPRATAMPEPARLRVGYVSGDFCDHPAGRQIEKVLASHDRSRFEIFLYSTSSIEDAFSAQLRGYADGWQNLSGLGDEEAAQKIVADGIHVLIDLSGH